MTPRERGCYPERALQRPTGKINLIGLVLLLGAAALVYSVVMFNRPVLDNLDVKEAISAAYNQAEGLDEHAIKQMIENRTQQVGEHDEDDGYGNIKTVSGLGLTDDNITVERNEVAHSISIRVDYARKVILAPTHKVYVLKLHPEQSGPIVRR